MGRLIDLTGQRFGRLLVLKENGRNKSGHVMWLCRCECGALCSVDGYRLRIGESTSCGCYHREVVGNMFRKYDSVDKRLYRIWKLMHSRCYNKNNPKYKNYGARGIEISPEWKEDFKAFESWAFSNGYRDDLTIDRKDVDGPYSPENCRWTTNAVQCNNKTDNVFLEYNGCRKTISEWARLTGIKASTLYARVSAGWTVEELLLTSPEYGNRVKVNKNKLQNPSV